MEKNLVAMVMGVDFFGTGVFPPVVSLCPLVTSQAALQTRDWSIKHFHSFPPTRSESFRNTLQ